MRDPQLNDSSRSGLQGFDFQSGMHSERFAARQSEHLRESSQRLQCYVHMSPSIPTPLSVYRSLFSSTAAGGIVPVWLSMSRCSTLSKK